MNDADTSFYHCCLGWPQHAVAKDVGKPRYRVLSPLLGPRSLLRLEVFP